MNNFPLYNNLSKDIPKKDLSVKEKQEFMSKIQNIDDIGKDLVYALIQFYRMINDTEIYDQIPYKGIIDNTIDGKSNITWSFSDFPVKLRHILYKFIKMHMQSMEEDQSRIEQVKL
jgi:hypothetical protein